MLNKSERELERAWERALDDGAVTSVFQPIASLQTGDIVGYEALSRGPAGTALADPQALFAHAEQRRQVLQLDYLCRFQAIARARALGLGGVLFVNVHPQLAADPRFRRGLTRTALIEGGGRGAEEIAYELHAPGGEPELAGLRRLARHYKEQDYQIALEGASLCYGGLSAVQSLHPQFVKLRMDAVRGIDRDRVKEALLASFLAFAHKASAKVIATGVETERELRALVALGVDCAQGYAIARPQEQPVPLDAAVRALIREESARRGRALSGRISTISVDAITSRVQAIPPSMKTESVHALLEADDAIPGFCVVDGDELLGVITRRKLHSKVGGQYGYSLYAHKPIRQLLSTNYVRAESDTPIDEVAKLAMQREPAKLYDFITVTQRGRYYGIVTVKDLLEETIQIEVNNAKHLNPLTELPGNLLIEREMERCLRCAEPRAVIYFDIDNFKPYNDIYGFEKGDAIIKLVASILKAHMPPGSFIGHIGGDDFIAITPEASTRPACEAVLATFEEGVRAFYRDGDLAQQFLLARNRHGVEERFPLLTLSAAGVSNRSCETVFALSERASAIKNACKQLRGSNFLWDEAEPALR